MFDGKEFPPDFNQGNIISEAPGKGKGFWAGAPSIMVDQEKNRFLLYYRLRSPDERGYKGVIAESEDGINFRKIWSVSKGQLNAHSLERASLIKKDEKYRLYISRDPLKAEEFQNWCIELIEGDSINDLNPSDRTCVLKTISKEVSSLKDPYIFEKSPQYKMLVSCHPKDGSSSNTGLATSKNGKDFDWEGKIFSHNQEWNRGIGRVTSVLSQSGFYYLFYDYEKDMSFSGEEKSGLAISSDLEEFKKSQDLTFKSPYGAGSLRYVTCIKRDERIYFYYEISNESGAHELCVSYVNFDTWDRFCESLR